MSANEHSSETIGRYVVRVMYDDTDRGILTTRDCDNVGRVAGLSDYTFNDDTGSYRDIRAMADEPIVAIPLSCWSQSYTLLQETDWDGANGFYWAPISAAEEWDGDVEALKRCLRLEVQAMAAELAGDIYGYVVENAETGEHVDSCWGFVGYVDGLPAAQAEGRSVAEWHNHHDACVWAELPEWVRRTVLIGSAA